MTWHKKRKPGLPTCISRGILAVIFLSFAVSGILFGLSWFLVHPVRKRIEETPEDYGLSFEEITFSSRGGDLMLEGWWLRSENSRKTVILAHGYRDNRIQQDVSGLSFAQDLIRGGYNVLMFDFRNCGKSEGNRTSIGFHEVDDLLGATDFALKDPDTSHVLVVIGFSMGASTAILAAMEETRIDAVVADSPFADLNGLLKTKFGPFGDAVIQTAKRLLDIDQWEVDPLGALAASTGKPLFIIHGAADQVIPVCHSTEIFAAAGSSARLWIVPGAKHLKAREKAGKCYSSRILEFLDENLGH